MDVKSELKKALENQKNTMEVSLVRAREAQRNAPSAMESHSDTTRSEKERLVTAIELNLRRVGQLLQKLDAGAGMGNLWSVHEITLNGEKVKCCLVPGGMGGFKIGDLQMVSADSPLGKQLLVKKSSLDLN